MSREPWNTGTGGGAVCEDMPRKSLDIRFTDHPLVKGKGQLRLSLLPARTGPGRAREKGQGTSPLRVLRAAP